MKWIKRIFLFCLFFLFFGILGILSINFYVVGHTKSKILTQSELKDKNIDAILVLGCQVRSDKTPSPMLEDRLLTGISLYQSGIAPVMIMSGDHGTKYYNEVQVMKDYAIGKEVPSSHIFMDHAGFSTYDSVYRVKEIFGVKNVVIVSQSYHLYRALDIAESLGLNAYGFSSDGAFYSKQAMRELREILARNKDFFLSRIRTKSKYLGEKIDLRVSGDVTNNSN